MNALIDGNKLPQWRGKFEADTNFINGQFISALFRVLTTFASLVTEI